MIKRFDKIKTIQLVVYVVLTIAAVIMIFTDSELYHMVATNGHVRMLCLLLWITYGLSFVFIYYDMTSYSALKRDVRELDFAVYSDPLTGIANRYSCDAFIEQYLDKPLPKDMGAIMFDITNMREINEKYGHVGGNNVIREFSSILQSASINTCFVGRNGGNKFLAIFKKTNTEQMEDFLFRVECKINLHNSSTEKGEILYRYGVAFNEGADVKDISMLIALANRRISE